MFSIIRQASIHFVVHYTSNADVTYVRNWGILEGIFKLFCAGFADYVRMVLLIEFSDTLNKT